MSTLREKNLEVAIKKLDELEDVIGTGFNSPYEFHGKSYTQEDLREELNEEYEDDEDNECFKFFMDEKIYMVGFLDKTGERIFIDLDEVDSPVYMYDDDGEVWYLFKIENYTKFAKTALEIDKMDLTDKEKYTKIQDLSEELLDIGAATLICCNVRRCYEF